MLPHFGSEFLPEFREGHFVLDVQMTPGTSLTEIAAGWRADFTRIIEEPKY